MPKFLYGLLALPLVVMVPVSIVDAAILGPDAGVCVAGNGPAILVRVSGFKNRVGKVRARAFAGNVPSSWFDKKRALKRIEVPVPASGVADICVPVPRAGGYVVDIRHDLNNNGDTDRSDGAGVSGNPNISVFDFFLGKKPPAAKVVVTVAQAVATVPITVKYIQGGSFKPAQVAGR